MRGQTLVLLLQDTTSLDFSHHPAAQGMGPLENPYGRGFLAHSTLATSRAGVPLGLLEQQVGVRLDSESGKRHQRHETAFADKESYQWVTGLPDRGSHPPLPRGVTVGDREGHSYEFLDEVLGQGLDFIVRASQGRSFIPDGQDLFAAVAGFPVQGRYSLALKRRPAQVELRYGTLTLQRPQRAETTRTSLTVQVVEVIEPAPPAGEEGVQWVLVTSLPVATVEQAQQVVTWYTYRWLIERFHYVLKSGCKLEERQLREEQRLERLLAVYSLVAWNLLWLTYQARQTPDALCTVALHS
jgi:hypothetical protein